MICYRKRLESSEEPVADTIKAGLALIFCVAMAWANLALIAA